MSWGASSVADLAARFDVTPETIRRDLDALAGRGLLSRVHGGAVPADKLRLAEAVGAREVSFPEEKLGHRPPRAVELLPRREGLTVLLDAGTTTGRLCCSCPNWVGLDRDQLGALRGGAPQPGRRWRSGCSGGRSAASPRRRRGRQAGGRRWRGLRVDVAFVGTNGFSVAHGFSTPDPGEAGGQAGDGPPRAREVFVLADSSKLGGDYLVSFAALADVDVLVTDSGLPGASVAELRAAGMRVELA